MLKIVSKEFSFIFILIINEDTKISLIVNNNFILVRKIIKIHLKKCAF